MDQVTIALQYLAAAGAGFCALAYVYGYIIRSKGDRRWHMASLLCSGIALANLAVVLPQLSTAGGAFCAAMAVVFLEFSVAAQAVTAFRGRRGDRRQEGREERRAERPAQAAA